jgi:hypothetical protein
VVVVSVYVVSKFYWLLMIIYLNLRFSQISGCWLILSVYILMSFDFPFVRLFGVRYFASFKTPAVLPIYTVKSGKRHENNSIPLFNIQFCFMHIQYKWRKYYSRGMSEHTRWRPAVWRELHTIFRLVLNKGNKCIKQNCILNNGIELFSCLLPDLTVYMGNTAGILKEAGTVYSSRASEYTRGFFDGVCVVHLLIFCVVLLCVFTFWVPSYNVRYDFRMKTMFGSSLPPVVCRRAHVLFTFCFVCCA